jgi:hypothetical protein
MSSSDCWHLATPLYLAETPGEISFLTLDTRHVRPFRPRSFNWRNR